MGRFPTKATPKESGHILELLLNKVVTNHLRQRFEELNHPGDLQMRLWSHQTVVKNLTTQVVLKFFLAKNSDTYEQRVWESDLTLEFQESQLLALAAMSPDKIGASEAYCRGLMMQLDQQITLEIHRMQDSLNTTFNIQSFDWA